MTKLDLRPPESQGRTFTGALHGVRRLRSRARDVRTLGCVLGVVLSAGACSDEPAGPPTTVTEGPGETRVVTHRPEWSDVRDLVLEEVAVFASDEAEGVFLSQVRAGVVLDGGGVALLDGRARQLIEYTSDGQVRRVLGGNGDGPGEFRNPRSLTLLTKDSLAVFDLRANRLTVFGADSDIPTIHALPSDVYSLPPNDLWVHPDGSWVTFEGNRREAAPLARGPDGSTVGALAVVRRLAFDGSGLDTLYAEGIASEMFVRGDMLLLLPFARSTRVDATEGVLAIAASEGFRVRRFGPGETAMDLTMPSRNLPLDPVELDRLRDSIRALTVEAGVPFLAEATFHPDLQPASRPAFSGIRVAPDGRVLVREFEALGRRSSVWWLVSAAGRFQGRVRLPEATDVLQFNGEDMLIVSRDALDVPTVAIVRIDWLGTTGR